MELDQRFKYAQIIFGILVFVTVWILLASTDIVSTDHHYVFRRTWQRVYANTKSLYGPATQGYYMMHWSVILGITLTLPPVWGQALINTLALGGIPFAMYILRGRMRWWDILILGNMTTVLAMWWGNVDGLLCLGVGLGWWALQRRKPLTLGLALWILSIKPINVILPAVVLLWGVRKWSRREIALVVGPAIFTTLASFPIFGWDWPSRYVQAMRDFPPPVEAQQLALWHLLGASESIALLLGAGGTSWVVYRLVTSGALNGATMVLALVLNLVFSPYVLRNHYVLLAPVLALLIEHNRAFLVLCVLPWTPLGRVMLDWQGWARHGVDAIYAWTLCVICGHYA